MKKLFFMIVAMLCMSTAAMAQEAQSEYNIKVEKATMMKYLGLGDTLAERWDIWQNELQEQIDAAMKASEAQRPAMLKAAVTPYLEKIQKYVDKGTYEKYLNIFNTQCKNKHIDTYLK